MKTNWTAFAFACLGGTLIGIGTPPLRESPKFWIAMLGGMSMYVAGTLEPIKKD